LQVHRSHHIAASATVLLQQEHDAGEIESDVLKQADAMAGCASRLCIQYKELAAVAAAASKGDTTTATSTNGVADHTEPMAVQMFLEEIHNTRFLETWSVIIRCRSGSARSQQCTPSSLMLSLATEGLVCLCAALLALASAEPCVVYIAL
jgi:hypothetical protein